MEPRLRDEFSELGATLRDFEDEARRAEVPTRSEAAASDPSGTVSVRLHGQDFQVSIGESWERELGVDRLESAIAEALDRATVQRFDLQEFGDYEVVEESAVPGAPVAASGVAGEFLDRVAGLSAEAYSAELDRLLEQVRAHAVSRLRTTGPAGIALVAVTPDGTINHVGIDPEVARGRRGVEIERDIASAFDAARVSARIPVGSEDLGL